MKENCASELWIEKRLHNGCQQSPNCFEFDYERAGIWKCALYIWAVQR